MPSFYTVVRYLPRATAEEHVNVGVIAFDQDGNIQWVLRPDRRLALAMAGDRVEPALASLRQQLEGGLLRGPGLHRLSAEWNNSVQLSKPRASLLPISDLLSTIEKVFLYEPDPSP